MSAVRGDRLIERRLGHEIPVRDRLVREVDHRHVAQVGIGARTEPQLRGCRCQADVDRQLAEFAQGVEQAVFRRRRNGEDDNVDPRGPRKRDQVFDIAEMRVAMDLRGCTVAESVIEDAADPNVRVLVPFEGCDEFFARRPRCRR